MSNLSENELFLFREKPILIGRKGIEEIITDILFKKYDFCLTSQDIINNPEKFPLRYIIKTNLPELSKDTICLKNKFKKHNEVILLFDEKYKNKYYCADKNENYYELIQKGVNKKTAEEFRKLLKQNNFHPNIELKLVNYNAGNY